MLEASRGAGPESAKCSHHPGVHAHVRQEIQSQTLGDAVEAFLQVLHTTRSVVVKSVSMLDEGGEGIPHLGARMSLTGAVQPRGGPRLLPRLMGAQTRGSPSAVKSTGERQ
eukprot:11821805-Heterocapsa_arctica.AAC.1